MIKLKETMQAKPIITPAAIRATWWNVMFETIGVIAEVRKCGQRCLTK